MKSGIIYIATNLINGKQYVGQTSRSLKERMYAHIWANKRHFDCALNKHGLKNFYIFTIEYPKEELNYWEKYYIEMFNTFNTPNGYNHTSGGDVYDMSETSKIKLSESKKGRFCGEENPNYGNHKIAGENNYWFGKHHSEESIEKNRNSHLNLSVEAHINMSNGQKGNKNCVGRILSEETKKKISASLMNRNKILQLENQICY